MAVDGGRDPHAARRVAHQRAVRQAVERGHTIPSRRFAPRRRAFADAAGQPRFRAWLLGLFAATAILLAMTDLRHR
jgi:hypothetical protein